MIRFTGGNDEEQDVALVAVVASTLMASRIGVSTPIDRTEAIIEQYVDDAGLIIRIARQRVSDSSRDTEH